MKQLKLSIILLGFIMPSFAIAQGKHYLLIGKIGNLSSPAKAYLFIGEKIDSVIMNKGTFRFSGVVDEPKSAYLMINKNGTGIYAGQMGSMPYTLQLYIEPGKITVNSPDSINNAVVHAGPLNADYIKLRAQLKDSDRALSRLNKFITSASPELMRSDSFGTYVNGQLAAIGREQVPIFLRFIKNNPGSPMSLFVLKCYGGFDYSMLHNNNDRTPGLNELDSIYRSLSVQVRSGKPGTEFRKMIARLKKTTIGFMAADFTQPDTSGKMISLHSFKGKYVLIDFWASWCGPCRAENPNVVQAFRKYNSKGFTVLGVSLDYPDAKKAWLKAIHDDHLTWAQVSDLKGWKNEVAQLYGVLAIPQNYLIDPTGKIIGVNLRGEALEDALKELNLN